MAHSYARPDAQQRSTQPLRKLPTGFELSADERTMLGIEPTMLRRTDLIVQITELEGCLRYMGSGHPLREASRQRLEMLRTLLVRWDHAVASTPLPSG